MAANLRPRNCFWIFLERHGSLIWSHVARRGMIWDGLAALQRSLWLVWEWVLWRPCFSFCSADLFTTRHFEVSWGLTLQVAWKVIFSQLLRRERGQDPTCPSIVRTALARRTWIASPWVASRTTLSSPSMAHQLRPLPKQSWESVRDCSGNMCIVPQGIATFSENHFMMEISGSDHFMNMSSKPFDAIRRIRWRSRKPSTSTSRRQETVDLWGDCVWSHVSCHTHRRTSFRFYCASSVDWDGWTFQCHARLRFLQDGSRALQSGISRLPTAKNHFCTTSMWTTWRFTWRHAPEHVESLTHRVLVWLEHLRDSLQHDDISDKFGPYDWNLFLI